MTYLTGTAPDAGASESSGWFRARYSDNTTLSVRIKERIYSCRTDFQKIEVIDTFDFGRMLVLDDIINVTTQDEFIYHEMLAHVPLFSHPDPKKVLTVGGGDGGIIREVMKHPGVDSACLVEIDPGVIEVSQKYLPSVSSELSNSRVSIVHDDAAAYVSDKKKCYDVVIIDSTDPIGPGESLFTEEFYRHCRSSLTDSGVFAAQSESPFFDPDIVAGIYRTARSVFPVVKMYVAFMPSYVSGIWSFLYCSPCIDPVKSVRQSAFCPGIMKTQYYSPDIHRACFTLPPFIKKQFDL